MTPILVLVLQAGCATQRTEAATRGETRPVPVDVIAVEGEPFQTWIVASGTALAARESYLSCPVPGVIREILVERGEPVEEGQALVRLDTKGYSLNVQEASAGIEAAQAQVDQVELELAKLQALYDKGAMPRAEIDRLEAQLKAARAQLEMARAGRKQAKKAVDDGVLRAPYDGVIADVYHEVGENATAMPPTMLARIVDASSLEVQVFLPEDASPWVHEGDAAEVEFETMAHSATGEVIFVSSSMQPVTHTFEVRIRVDNSGGEVKAGAFALVRLVKESLENAVLAPIEAVRGAGTDEPFVFVVEGGKAMKVPVVLGDQEGGRVQVASGLEPGALLVGSGVADLVDGQPVKTP